MSDLKHKALDHLLHLSREKGYLINADILDTSDRFDLEIADLAKLTSEILVHGIILYEEDPEELDAEDFVDKAHLDYDALYDELNEIDPIFRPLVNDLKKIIPAQTREIEKLYKHIIEGNQHAKERLIEIHLRAAVRRGMIMATEKGHDIHDTISIAFNTLLDTAEKYDATTDSKFSGNFGLKTITDFKRNLPLRRGSITVPAHLLDDYYTILDKIEKTDCIHCPKLAYCEKVNDIIQKTIEGCSSSRARTIQECMVPEMTIQEAILDNPEKFSDHGKSIESIDEMFYLQTLKEAISEALSHLSERECYVIIQRFGLNGDDPLTLDELGKKMEVTRERVRQIEAKAIKKLSIPAIKNKLKIAIETC